MFSDSTIRPRVGSVGRRFRLNLCSHLFAVFGGLKIAQVELAQVTWGNRIYYLTAQIKGEV
jgi:hypothetical protein